MLSLPPYVFSLWLICSIISHWFETLRGIRDSQIPIRRRPARTSLFLHWVMNGWKVSAWNSRYALISSKSNNLSRRHSSMPVHLFSLPFISMRWKQSKSSWISANLKILLKGNQMKILWKTFAPFLSCHRYTNPASHLNNWTRNVARPFVCVWRCWSIPGNRCISIFPLQRFSL